MAALGPAGAGEPGSGGEAEAGALLPREPLYNWQATKASLKERFAFLFNSELLSDVRFVLGKGRGAAAAGAPPRVPAHRFVLAAGSAVFDAMFNGGMATTSAEIELPDVEPAAFLALLRFLYSDEVQIGPETVMTTLYTAKKYAVPALEAHCVEFLTKHLRADNAFMLLTQGLVPGEASHHLLSDTDPCVGTDCWESSPEARLGQPSLYCPCGVRVTEKWLLWIRTLGSESFFLVSVGNGLPYGHADEIELASEECSHCSYL